MRLWDFVEPCVYGPWILKSLTYIRPFIIKLIGNVHHRVYAGVNNTGGVGMWGRGCNNIPTKVILKKLYCIFCTGEYENIITFF